MLGSLGLEFSSLLCAVVKLIILGLVNLYIWLLREFNMKKLYIALLLFLIFLVSCSKQKLEKADPINGSFPVAHAELREVIKSIVEDAETANIDGLKSIHLASDKFTKFGPRRFDRQNVESTNESESVHFGSISNFSQEVRDLKIDVFGDVGIATYYPHVSYVQDGIEKSGSGLQTLVFIKTLEGWKIIHEHGTAKQE